MCQYVASFVKEQIYARDYILSHLIISLIMHVLNIPQAVGTLTDSTLSGVAASSRALFRFEEKKHFALASEGHDGKRIL